MRRLTFYPATLEGSLQAVPSKSYAIRMLLCSALADRSVTLDTGMDSGDLQAARVCMEALGCQISFMAEAKARITPPAQPATNPLLPCGQSGTLLRMLLPVVAALGTGGYFTGDSQLERRPLAPLAQVLAAHGATLSSSTLPLTVSGRLRPGKYRIDGSLSSQYISGLLLALPLLEENSLLQVDGAGASAGYIDMTLEVMRLFGVHVVPVTGGYEVAGKQCYRTPEALPLEGDWSQAAAWLVAGALGGPVCVRGLNADSLQGDRIIVTLLEQMGAQVKREADSITVQAGPLHAVEVSLDRTPDLAPVLCAACACATGTSRLKGINRLRYKESDRLKAICAVLRASGIAHRVEEDCLCLTGGKPTGACVSSFDDHRMVMMEALLALKAQGPVSVEAAEALEKSYPHFVSHYRKLGGIVTFAI